MCMKIASVLYGESKPLSVNHDLEEDTIQMDTLSFPWLRYREDDISPIPFSNHGQLSESSFVINSSKITGDL